MSPHSLSSLLASANPKMQSLSVSPSSSSTSPFANRIAIAKLSPQLLSHFHPFSSSPLTFTIKGLSSCPSSFLLLRAGKSSPFLISAPKISSFRVLAASLPEAKSDEPSKPSDLVQTLQLGVMFATWYLLNIYFNIYNKQVLKVYPFPATVTAFQFEIPNTWMLSLSVLKVYPFPATVTAFQFGFASLMINLIWTLNLHPRPNITRSQFLSILPLALAHTMGNLLTNISLGKVAVSFTHTIKSMEPFFTVVLSSLFLGERPSFWVVSSLVPIVGGVSLASMTEVSFNWIGFSTAMASNLTNQSRNVLSKKLMANDEETLDNINLYSVITIISFILLVPFAIFYEGIKFTPSYLQSAASQGLNVRELCVRSILAALCFHAYQQVSYGILQKVSPVTHSVGNCVKRVVVIVSSVIFFQYPVSPFNALGTAIALVGVFLYSRAKRSKSVPKTA